MRNGLPNSLLRVAHVMGISVVRRSFIKKGSYISNFHAEFSVQFLTVGCTVCMRLTTGEAAQSLRGAELTQCVAVNLSMCLQKCATFPGRDGVSLFHLYSEPTTDKRFYRAKLIY